MTTISWAKGFGSFPKQVIIAGNDYLKIVNSTPLISTDTSYNMIVRQLYQYLITSMGIAGVITNP